MAIDAGLSAPVIALAGNPNVGKSTIFNSLTGMHQHTGNWPGKTVAGAEGRHFFGGREWRIVDLPGTYSISAHSVEEKIARDYLCFANPSAVIVVCDATCLERNLNLVLQIREITQNIVVCVNLLDEAAKKQIVLDLPQLSRLLGLPVVGASARAGRGVRELMEQAAALTQETKAEEAKSEKAKSPLIPRLTYPQPIEEAISRLQHLLDGLAPALPRHWLALQLLDKDGSFLESLATETALDIEALPELARQLDLLHSQLAQAGYDSCRLRDEITAAGVKEAEAIAAKVVRHIREDSHCRDRLIDNWITGRFTGMPLMLALLALVFWITIVGANYPSAALSTLFFALESSLARLLSGFPAWFSSLLVEGVYRTLTWVVSVMLPPMAIFFPLFTLLEDAGYLPRVAFNLDHYFQKCGACGKQALTMAMGFGCNAAGVIGCRIIDSPRERLIAVITNSLVPCNGRFPTLIAIITMFFTVNFSMSATGSLSLTILLTAFILLGILMTFLSSAFLSHTLLKGIPSSFALELPPYRRPQFHQVIIRSVFDRTLFVLGRALVAAAPAGLIIWLLANINAGSQTLLSHFTGFLDPAGRLMGLDGVILMAFILGFPANEIVVPLIIMTYGAGASLTEADSLLALKTLLLDNGWTWVTALCAMVFCLFHFPCATTFLTIKKETQSWRWALLAFFLPTAIGICFCLLINGFAHLFVL